MCRGFGHTHRLGVPMLIDTSGTVEQTYQVTRTPFAYVLNEEGRVVMRGLVNDWRHLESLLEQEGTLEAGRAWTVVGSAAN